MKTVVEVIDSKLFRSGWGFIVAFFNFLVYVNPSSVDPLIAGGLLLLTVVLIGLSYRHK